MNIELTNSEANISLPLPFDEWVRDSSTHAGLAAQLLSDTDALGVDTNTQKFTLPLQTLAAWSEPIARAAKLPPNSPLPLDIRASQGLGKTNTKLNSRWLRPGTTLPITASPRIEGLCLHVSGKTFRLQEPYFTSLRLIEEFNALSSDDTTEQFRVWSSLRKHLGEEQIGNVSDFNLRALRVISADSFTLNFKTDQHGNVQLVPVLMADASTEGLDPNETAPRALLEADETLFINRLDEMREGSAAFPLADGTYVVVDERLQKALAVMREARQASPEVRKRAVLNPELFLAEHLGDEILAGKPLFIETESYSKRVLDVAEWIPQILPWQKIASQDWSPSDEAGFRVGGKDIPLGNSNEIAQSIRIVEEAIAAGEATAVLHDPKNSKISAEVPANTATLTALGQLHKAVLQRESPELIDDEKEDKSHGKVQVLIIETNFEETGYLRSTVGRRSGSRRLPDCLRNAPKPHQEDGISWLQQHWLSGSKGALLADDMGLGKTYQSLAFMGWLRELMQEGLYPKKPIMIVAPVGLLKNWEEEHNLHLLAPGAGALVRAYGPDLRKLKQGAQRNGTVSLDTGTLQRADWILANYETINNYQLSFGSIEFAIIIYDEAQKIKSPAVRVTQAAKAMNTEFTLAMTGTPVENRLADLWCIADTVQPGALGDLKEFSQRYEKDPSEDVLLSLRNMIWHEPGQDDDHPRMMLRRLKIDKLKGLPQKKEVSISVPMPPRQQEAYERAVTIKQTKGPSATLEMIQALRSISLHPATYEGGFSAENSINPDDSARFIACFNILDNVYAKQEKALIFVESLELQSDEHLPLMLMRKYHMRRAPLVINGEVDTATRQRRVRQFQEENGFDVMLLSPKAGGVGITLTKANHVIHLSRWWNPAVEDQCSDRAYRIGQEKDVTIYYLIAEHPGAPTQSFDVKLDQLMARKRQLSQRLLAPSIITKEDMSDLLDDLNVF